MLTTLTVISIGILGAGFVGLLVLSGLGCYTQFGSDLLSFVQVVCPM